MAQNVKTNEEHVLSYQLEPRRRRVLRMDKPGTDSESSWETLYSSSEEVVEEANSSPALLAFFDMRV